MNNMTEMERWYAYGDENGSGPWNDDYPFDGEIERWHTDEHGEMHSSTIGYQLGICQNCDKELPRELALRGTLFCSEKCQQTAKAVRYGRATLRDGRFKRDPLVREALDTRIAIILGGGYPAKVRTLSREQREAIFMRDDRRCRLCGAPATDIDYIAGSSSDPKNLQALCKSCNLAKARAHFRPATLEEAVEGNAIWARIRATQPVRLCDDKTKWDTLWRKIASEQRKFARSV